MISPKQDIYRLSEHHRRGGRKNRRDGGGDSVRQLYLLDMTQLLSL